MTEDTLQSTPSSFDALEKETIRFWKENDIYAKTLKLRHGGTPFVFYEGPPTANGLPHPGHCLTRAIKDLYPRYKTMKGFYCERKGGWDTHGLPVEVEVCKEIGIHSKEEIERYGIEPFIRRCQESVFRYTKQWEDLTERLGFWINLDEAYVTYHQSFIESVWWSLKSFFDRGLLYQGHKIVWWWAQGGTALSSGEVGQGYREVADPSVFVRFPLVDPLDGDWSLFNEDLCIAKSAKHGFTGVVDLLVWTTTPWTLPSNQFAAVHPKLDYALVQLTAEDGTQDDRLTIIAAALVDQIAAKVKKKAVVLETFTGDTLVGKRYAPPFSYYYDRCGKQVGTLKSGGKQTVAWRAVGADFVTLDSGTGLVHQAPAFGEVDFDVLTAEQERFVAGEGPELICAVAPDGTFTEEAPGYEGRWVKDADKDIIRELRARHLLFHQEQYLHDYPFCWRSDRDPLIQYPRKSWFVKTSQFKKEMLAENATINWFPEHIKNGRFGNFLETNVDWALSRERYWGTPLPIWVCDATGQMEAVDSYAALLQKPGVQGTDIWEKAKAADPELNEDLKIHKPYIDAITYDSPFRQGSRMRRVSEVIDCWYDSGAMPFAQWGYPHEPGSKEIFEKNFPADFISEALDQTRGWFYSQHAISTLLFGKADFRNCIVLGLMLGEDGQKMSKSKRNYREPNEIFVKYGADALRWYFYANQTPWTVIRYSEQAIKDSMPEFLIRLSNVLSFYEVYGKIDDFNPIAQIDPEALRRDRGQLNPSVLRTAKTYRPVGERRELDRWILGELNETIKIVTEKMDAYDHYTACGRLSAFVDSLSNWYVRRSRDRFWSSSQDTDPAVLQSKNDAYWTLFECLLTTAKLIAPFVPFLAERMCRQLTGAQEPVLESIHLCDYPEADTVLFDPVLSETIALQREIVSVGRNARMNAKLKVRQPLSKIEVIFSNVTQYALFGNAGDKTAVANRFEEIKEELNVKTVEVTTEISQFVSYNILPNLKKLGARLGKRLPLLKNALADADGTQLVADMKREGRIVLSLEGEPIELTSDDIQIRLTAKEGWAAADGPNCVVILATELTPELVSEGFAREIIRMIQNRRKEIGCEYTDRIEVGVATESRALIEAVERFRDYIQSETLAVRLHLEPIIGVEPMTLRADEEPLDLYVKRLQTSS